MSDAAGLGHPSVLSGLIVEQLLLTYGPLGVMVLVAGYFIRELYKSNQSKDQSIIDLQNKRLEDYKVLVSTLQENAAASKVLADTLEDQSDLIEKLIIRPVDDVGSVLENRKKRRQ